GPDIYISHTYSFENWRVSRDVLNNILCVALHCHGEHLVREEVLATFDEVYDSFLKVTRSHNERLFMARRLGIETKPLPTRLAKLAEVSLTEVKVSQEKASTVINLQREPSQAEIVRERG